MSAKHEDLTPSASADEGVRVPFYRVIDQPEDLAGAKELAEEDKYGFQWWILPLIGAKAFGSEAGKKEGKKGADGGIDGMIVFTYQHRHVQKGRERRLLTRRPADNVRRNRSVRCFGSLR